MIDVKGLSNERLLELHYRLYEAVEINERATFEDMRLYFLSRYELEHRGFSCLPGTPHWERSDAA